MGDCAGGIRRGAFLGISAALIVVASGLLGMILLSPPRASTVPDTQIEATIIVYLFWLFALISLLAFCLIGAALAQVERLAMSEAAFLSPQYFSSTLSFFYFTPNPFLITATFIFYLTTFLSFTFTSTLGIPDSLALRLSSRAAAPALHSAPRASRALFGRPLRRC